MDLDQNSKIIAHGRTIKPFLYTEIKEILLREAKAQIITDGDRLLPEPELARHFNVSRNTLRTALRSLEQEGMIVRFPKKGTFLTHLPVEDMDSRPAIGVNFLMNPNSISANNSILNGIIRSVKKNGLRLLHVNENEMTAIPKEMKGIIFITTPQPTIPLYNHLVSGSIPAVCTRKRLSSKVGYVGVDNRLEAKRGVCALIEHGCRKIGFWGNPPVSGHAEDRYLGYTDALRSMGLPVEEKRVFFISPDSDKYEQAVMFLKSADIDAVFVALSPVLFSLVYAMNQLHLRIGSDIRLLCFDNLAAVGMNGPLMSYIRMPLEEIGERAAEYLYHKIFLKQNLPVLNQMLSAEIHLEM